MWCLEIGLEIALQAMQEKKALIWRIRGRLLFFLELWRQCGVSHEVQQGAREASLLVPGKSGLHSLRVARGSALLLLSHCRAIVPQDALKKVSRGLSRVAAGNPGFPRLVPVTSGSFSRSL